MMKPCKAEHICLFRSFDLGASKWKTNNGIHYKLQLLFKYNNGE